MIVVVGLSHRTAPVLKSTHFNLARLDVSPSNPYRNPSSRTLELIWFRSALFCQTGVGSPPPIAKTAAPLL